MIRFDQTPPPSPSWDRHLSTEARLELALREGRPTVIQQRDTGDEQDDGLEVME
jgi:hypothetical protein